MNSSEFFFHLLLKNIFEVCFLVSVSISLRFIAYGLLHMQKLLDSDSAGSAR